MICGAIYLFPRLFGGGDTVEPTNIPDNGDNSAQGSSDNINLGSLEISEDIDRDGCATDNISSLQNANRFFVVAPNSEFPTGTEIFARLYKDGDSLEDVGPITADQDYSSTCVNFVFETTNGDDFDSGEYEVEFFVNGNSYDSIRFNID
jgi:hypothetical protein